jgi:aryl-alcohol dehydrogenase
MKIRAAVVRQPSSLFEIETVELDGPRDDEVLVRIVSCGVCRTDLEARDGRLPIPPPPSVFGHEGAGVVVKTGSRVTKVKCGDPVVLGWSSCGECESCRSGYEPYCDAFYPLNFDGTRPDGTTTLHKDGEAVHSHFFGQSSFAEYVVTGERNVIKVSPDVPLDILGPMGCGIRTGAGAVMNSLNPRPGSSIAVFGVGPVGMSAILAAVVRGCNPIVAIDLNPDRVEMSLRFGATHIVNPGAADPVAAVLDITKGGADYSLECTGVPAVLRQAVRSLLRGGPRCGVCGLLGSVPPGTEVTLDMDMILAGRTVRGILAGDSAPGIFIPQLIDLYRQGRFPFDRMITFYPFDAINQAARDMEKGIVLKPVLRF